MKKKLYQIHKWAGLTLGIIILILAITGIGLSFREELMPKLYPELFQISGGEKLLPLPRLYEQGLAHVGMRGTITNLYSSSDPQEAWMLIFKSDEQLFPTMVTINPFTGAIVGEMSMIKNAFAIMLFLHTNLMIGKAGSYLVGFLGFVLALFVGSGIYLWLPRTKVKDKLLKTLSGMKTSSQSAHHSLGLLFSIPLVVSGITGFLIVYDLSYYVARPLKQEAVRVEEMERKGQCSITDQLDTLKSLPAGVENKLISIHFCTKKSSLMKVSSGLRNNDFLEGYERIIIDPTTQETLQTFNSDKDPKSWNIKRLFIYPLHTGEMFGMFGRAINLITGLGLTALIVTGFVLFKRRRIRNLQHKIYKTE